MKWAQLLGQSPWGAPFEVAPVTGLGIAPLELAHQAQFRWAPMELAGEVWDIVA